MVKGEDIERRKKNKAFRKKLHRKDGSSSAVSARVASLIASKKRRKSGTRRQCQGMCFSLPTLEDPFNDRNGKKDPETKVTKKIVSSKMDKSVPSNEKACSRKSTPVVNGMMVDDLKSKVKAAGLRNEKKKSLTSVNDSELKCQLKPEKIWGGPDSPSKYLIMCLNEIKDALNPRHNDTGIVEEVNPFLVSTWGIEFWKSYSAGNDIIETSGTSSTAEQIAWIVCSAADSISKKDEEGLSWTSPFLLFLVPSQDKATEVRKVCIPLKVHGIHAVSIHSGASLDHQIQGLKNCEPEFLIATPERLLELISLKAIDISGVSLLVIDGLEAQSKHGFIDSIKAITQSVSGNTQRLVFNDWFSSSYVPVLQNLVMGPIRRLSSNESVPSQSACIMQSVLTNSSDSKLPEAMRILNNAFGNQLSQPSKVLVVTRKNKLDELVPLLKKSAYSISLAFQYNSPEVENSVASNDGTRHVVSLIDIEQISSIDLAEYDFVLLLDFVLDGYIQILKGMARFTVKGALHIFLTDENTKDAGSLIKILKQCGQPVPESLRDLYRRSSIVGPQK